MSDIRLYREGLSEMLRREPAIAAVATACDEADVARQLADGAPDLVLVDMAMEDAIRVVRAVAGSHAGCRTLALTVPDSEDDVVACVEAGVNGYVTRAGGLRDVVDAVETVARGDMLCSPRIAGMLSRRVQSLAAQQPPVAGLALTSRERQVVALLDRGLSNKEIASDLCIELATAKNHVHNVLEKLGVRRRSEVSARIRRSGPAGPPG